ncbi:hypothetical protein PSTG_03131 [Puccinia striiformis f. sp. tritici PST-78]|uniref:Shieldin complex subunit 2 first OB fold domain-containing protein n=1 Tax=Puccinia striiformis f. sp. tritici PST-78 TaxID=1165861 RepID=A0A0L0VWG2_9BASI|nr:hypothetical protein PSTG_03131 [Puccinia striiformis f. sp. tritici PST-78]
MMSSKRYIVFGNPPTIHQLRTWPTSSDKPAWKTRTIFSSSPARPSSERPTQSQLLKTKSEPLLDLHRPSSTESIALSSPVLVAGPSRRISRNLTVSFESQDQHPVSRKRPKLGDERDEVHSGDASEVAATNSESMDYYQSQLDYRDSFADNSADTSLTPTPGNRTSCLLSHTQQDSRDPPSLPGANQPSTQSETTYSESMIVNPPQWHFDSRSCTPLDRLEILPGTLYDILIYVCDKKPLTTIELKKPRKDGSSTADLAHFECMDDSGSSLKLVLWEEVAESLDSACFVGDIIYLSGIAVSSYQGKPQASSTSGTRAQICFRLHPTHPTHLQLYCPDLRLAYDPTTRRVSQLVNWAKNVFS